MQEANRIRFAALLHQRGNRVTHTVFVQGDEYRSAGVHALVDFQAHVSGHERSREADLQVIGVKALFAANLQYVTKAARGDQPRASALALNDGIDDKGRAMNHRIGGRSGSPLPGRNLAHALLDRP